MEVRDQYYVLDVQEKENLHTINRNLMKGGREDALEGGRHDDLIIFQREGPSEAFACPFRQYQWISRRL